MIEQSFIQDLLARVDIVDVVGRSVELKRSGQNYLGLCPFHGEKTPSFTVSQSKQFFHCFGCGAHGSAIGFLMDQRGMGYVEAVQELAQSVGMQMPRESPRSAEVHAQRRSLVEINEKATAFYRRQLKSSSVAIEYLKGRGLTGVTAARFALGYVPDEWQPLRSVFDAYEEPRLVEAGLVIESEGKRYDRFRGRIMFPIRDRRGAVLGFGARVLGDGQPKYLNSPETPLFRKGQQLYGLFEAAEAIRKKGRVVVCEGYMDVIQLAQAGFEESVAALGTAVTSQHVDMLLRLSDNVIFSFDGDAAGRSAARRALEATLAVIPDTKRVSFALLPQGEDPDSLIRGFGAGAFESELARALSLSQWFLKSLGEGRDLSQPEDRAGLTAAARPLLESMPAGALRMQLVQALAQAVGAAAADLESLYGLTPMRRLPASRPPTRARASSRPVESLKSRLLRRLLTYPALAREFAPALIELLGPEVDPSVELAPAADTAAAGLNSEAGASNDDRGTSDRGAGEGAGVDPVHRQIREVLAAARYGEGELSCAALLEALAESDFAAQYRTLCADELQSDEDAAAVREEVAEGLLKIEEARVRSELDALVPQLQQQATDALRERHALLFRRLVELKQRRAVAAMVNR